MVLVTARYLLHFKDIFMCVSVFPACMYVHLVYTGASGGQMKVLDPGELQSQMSVRSLIGLLGPLQDQQVPLIPGPSLQLPYC